MKKAIITKPSVKEKDVLKERLKNYVDSGISTKQLDFGLWYLNHRKTFYLGLVALLFIFNLGLWLFFSWQSLQYFVLGGNNMPNELPTSNLFVRRHTELYSLDSSAARIIAGSQNKYDLIAKVANPVDRFVARFDYYFLVGNTKVGAGRDFVYPNDSKFVMALGQSLPFFSDSAQLVITNLTWQQLDRKTIPDWPSYKNSRTNFIISNQSLTDDGNAVGAATGVLNFTVANQTAFSYDNINFDLLLYSNNDVVGFSRYTLPTFKVSETRNIKFGWIGLPPIVDKIEVVPDFDILDQGVYLK